MASVTEKYPEIAEYLDDTDKYENTATELKQGNDRFLLVTQRGIDGQQLLFKWDGEHFEFWDNETILDATTASSGWRGAASVRVRGHCHAMRASSGPDHQKVHDYVVSEVNKFSSKTGPDHGNLACVWTVRNLVYNALNRWITKSDGTAVFEPELRACFGQGSNASDILPGGIVISPTRNIKGSKKRNIGHVGILGAGKGDARLIYSNSSRHARLEQNFTVSSWNARYRKTKGLSVLFYPLPLKSVPLIS